MQRRRAWCMLFLFLQHAVATTDLCLLVSTCLANGLGPCTVAPCPPCLHLTPSGAFACYAKIGQDQCPLPDAHVDCTHSDGGLFRRQNNATAHLDGATTAPPNMTTKPSNATTLRPNATSAISTTLPPRSNETSAAASSTKPFTATNFILFGALAVVIVIGVIYAVTMRHHRRRTKRQPPLHRRNHPTNTSFVVPHGGKGESIPVLETLTGRRQLQVLDSTEAFSIYTLRNLPDASDDSIDNYVLEDKTSFGDARDTQMTINSLMDSSYQLPKHTKAPTPPSSFHRMPDKENEF
ncbi:hypothetical protein SPRG_06721 [Saprolegnia parasitica CBS 223.65]|uniref:Uncharacterized protein n=1 Tax=Saprolegnia parasitica (strain CBS 223.65) TaxID=695850 RepID=A0A067CNT2_SAPPC|nr:hypothetical protein SPRG_06721 [Saprolegnia parasitica CBS 223.65]KDO28482.1 hypothetical protein SPRG_06721 [Saprolegnia parasitica CBS 223.65]|eukprot:XP_012200920.1 hypothetical protein SPRG_06721 [Saprolegnia parasitica CBS 223.65]